MTYFTTPLREGFQDELRKLAGWADVIARPGVSGALGAAGALGGVGAGVGSLVGAGVKGVQGYRDAREQGGTLRQSLGAGLRSGGKGALKGALLGAGAGAVGGAALGGLHPGAGEAVRSALTKNEQVGSLARMGQRQVHGLTGWHPGATIDEGMHELRHGAYDRIQALDKNIKGSIGHQHAAAQAAADAGHTYEQAGIAPRGNFLGMGKPKATDVVTHDHIAGHLGDEYREALAAKKTGLETQQKGLTHLPGIMQGMVDHPLDTIAQTAKEQWHGTSPAMKALMIGAPAAQLAHDAATADDGSGKSRLHRVIGDAVNIGTGSLLAPLPMISQMGLGSGINAATNAQIKPIRPQRLAGRGLVAELPGTPEG